VYWIFIHAPGKKAIAGANTRDFNRHPYRQSPPVSMTVSGVGGFTSSNTPTPCRRMGDPTHRDTRNLRNLTSGRDPEGKLAEGIDPASIRILGGRSIIIIVIITVTVTITINIYIHSPLLL
jgi:hypothetical protein